MSELLIRQRVPQSKSVEHVCVGVAVQVPVVVLQVSVGISQVTNPGFPQVERAAQRIALPRQPGDTVRFTTCATQLT